MTTHDDDYDDGAVFVQASWNKTLRVYTCQGCWQRVKPQARTPRSTRVAVGYVCPVCENAVVRRIPGLEMGGRWAFADGLDLLTAAVTHQQQQQQQRRQRQGDETT